MTIKQYFKGIVLLFCGGLLCTACPNDSESDKPAPAPSLTDDAAPGTSGGTALSTRTGGGWEDGGVDALSSASILRVDRGIFGYVDKVGTGYNIKLVNVSNPTKTVREKEVPDGKNVALWTTGDGGKIIMVTADETGYEAFSGHQVVVYDSELKVVKKVSLGNSTGEVAPLHHRDPALAVTDKYAVAGWDEEETGKLFISIYALAGDQKGHLLVTDAEGSSEGLGIGNLTAFSAHGDYIIIGGSTGTKVYRITDSGGNIILDEAASGFTQTPGSHWMLDNQRYVMESTAGNGQIRVWKWNGANPPSVVGSANVGATSGNVQAMSFDNGNPDQAYIFGRVADANEGEVYEVNLTNAAATKLFKLPRYEADKPLTGIWTIQVESFDSDRYFIFGGSVFAPPRGQTGESKHGVFVVKNPPSDGSAITSTTMFQTLVEFPTAVRTMKSFLVNAHDIVYAAKNYTDGANYHQTDYKLRLIEVKDD